MDPGLCAADTLHRGDGGSIELTDRQEAGIGRVMAGCTVKGNWAWSQRRTTSCKTEITGKDLKLGNYKRGFLYHKPKAVLVEFYLEPPRCLSLCTTCRKQVSFYIIMITCTFWSYLRAQMRCETHIWSQTPIKDVNKPILNTFPDNSNIDYQPLPLNFQPTVNKRIRMVAFADSCWQTHRQKMDSVLLRSDLIIWLCILISRSWIAHAAV